MRLFRRHISLLIDTVEQAEWLEPTYQTNIPFDGLENLKA